MLPDDYEALLRGPDRPPSCLLALLPVDAKPPTVPDLRHRLQESTLDIESISVVEEKTMEDASWELEVLAEGRMYEIWLVPSEDVSEIRGDQAGVTAADWDAAARSRWSIGVTCVLGSRPLPDYDAQLHVAAAAAPGAALLLDANAQRARPGGWLDVREGLPKPHDLYTVHAVHQGDGNRAPIWLHTHGLLRCGTVELEMVGGVRALANTMSSMIAEVAEHFLAEGTPPPCEVFEAGKTKAIWLPWEQGIEKFPFQGPGHREDRDEVHRVPSGLIFAPTLRDYFRR